MDIGSDAESFFSNAVVREPVAGNIFPPVVSDSGVDTVGDVEYWKLLVHAVELLDDGPPTAIGISLAERLDCRSSVGVALPRPYRNDG